MKRVVIVIAALIAAARSPPAPKSEAPPGEPGIPAAEAPNPERDAMTAALAPRVQAEIGQPVTFAVNVMRVQNDWGWLVAQPWTPDGTQIDWSQTHYAQRAADGVLDGGGTTYALLKRENGQWRVVDVAIGPTDVAYADWSERYGAPDGLMQTN